MERTLQSKLYKVGLMNESHKVYKESLIARTVQSKPHKVSLQERMSQRNPYKVSVIQRIFKNNPYKVSLSGFFFFFSFPNCLIR